MTRTLLSCSLFVLLSCGNASAATVLTTDFDSHLAGPATVSSLNAVTSGGTWTLASTSDLTHSISDNGSGDRAFLSAESNLNNSRTFAQIAVDSPHDFTEYAQTWSMDVAPRRSEGNSQRNNRYEFFSGGTRLIGVRWRSNDNVQYNNGSSWTNFGTEGHSAVNPWDPAQSNPLTAVFIGNQVTLTLGGASTTVTGLNGLSSIDEFRFIGQQTGSGSDPIGGYLDNITVTAVPEPSSFALASMMVLCVVGVAFRRMRRAV